MISEPGARLVILESLTICEFVDFTDLIAPTQLIEDFIVVFINHGVEESNVILEESCEWETTKADGFESVADIEGNATEEVDRIASEFGKVCLALHVCMSETVRW